MKFLRKLFGQSDSTVNNPTSDSSKERQAETILLNEIEKQLCLEHGLDLADGLFLKTQTQQNIEVFHYKPEYSEKEEEPVFLRSRTTKTNAKRILNAYYDTFQAKGKLLFYADDWLTEEVIGIFPYTADAFEVMAFAGTNGVNAEIYTEDIVNKIKEWQGLFRLRVTGIGLDSCTVEILEKDIDYKALAADVHDFCPDVAYERRWTLDQLEEEIRATNTILLWWD